MKREFGKGLVGRALKRTLKRNIVNKDEVNEQMRQISDHRYHVQEYLHAFF